MIDVTSLTYTYPTGKTIQFPNFAVERGEHCLLLGESGCGKTTLLHLLGGLLRTNTGSIKVGGQELRELSEAGLDGFRGEHIGFIFQKNHLISALTVEQNLLLAPYLSKKEGSRVADVLNALNLPGIQKKKITTLSQGQAQRVAIARALMNKPDVILADEPTSALDDRNCDAVIELLMNVAKENQTTLVIATHDSRLKSKVKRQIDLR
ncbi:MAG TPA: ATP-binding cassette domain-containing protein [Cyclobacteriaceae bacterium]|nr:ATP-binding cassette domain-containing protein [Cyclobacteriaceae bacterium]